MTIPFHRWPDDRARRYRALGYWIDAPLTRILDEQVRLRPQAPCILCGNRSLTYAELDRLSSNLAGRLGLHGFAAGDTALVQLPNVAEFYIVFFALLKAGIAPVNALYGHRRFELAAYAEQIRPSLIVASRSHDDFRTDDLFSEFETRGLVPRLRLLLDEHALEASLERWLRTPPDRPVPLSATQADQVAFFQLSGGSTGTPKLIPRTHNDYYYSVRESAKICRIGPATRFLCALPAPHNYTLSSPGVLGVFHAGGCVVLAPSPEPLSCFALIARHAVTMAALVPSAVAMWLEAAPPQAGALASLELVQVGGASFAEALARRVPEVLGCRLQQVFGMAEGLVNYTRLDDPDDIIFTTQGRPISPDDETQVVDEAGTPVADGAVGLLATRGPYTFCGYYNSPQHNEQVFDEAGFYYTGDLVRRLPGGYFQVVGRVKDTINRGGEKIAAEEIENLLLRHPDIHQAAVVAMHDALLGEKSCVFVVPKNGAAPTLPQIRKHLIQFGIADYKLPDRVRTVDALPLTVIGKTDKASLRNRLSQTGGSRGEA